MRIQSSWQKAFAIVVVLSFSGVAVLSTVGADAKATHLPADKIAVAGSSMEVMSADFSPTGSPILLPLFGGGGAGVQTSSGPVGLGLDGRMRTSSPTDLIFTVALECALWTDITTVNNTMSEAEATVKVWVTMNGVTIPVSSDDEGEDAGKVVFCNRAYKRTTTNFTNNETIETFIRTRSANSFSWITTNVGNGIKDLQVWAELETQVSGTGEAKAAIGKRTLVVEPVKLANDVTV